MSKAALELKERLRKLTIPPDATLDGTVTAVDETDYTCTVTLPAGLVLQQVQLKALKGKTDCLVVIPTVGAIVQLLNVGEPDWMVISADEVDKVILTAATKLEIKCDNIALNGGSNGGLVILSQLQSNLDTLKSYCEALNTTISTALGAITTAGGGAVIGTTYDTSMSAHSINFSDMEDTKVTH